MTGISDASFQTQHYRVRCQWWFGRSPLEEGQKPAINRCSTNWTGQSESLCGRSGHSSCRLTVEGWQSRTGCVIMPFSQICISGSLCKRNLRGALLCWSSTTTNVNFFKFTIIEIRSCKNGPAVLNYSRESHVSFTTTPKVRRTTLFSKNDLHLGRLWLNGSVC